jgi:ATP-binding cassette subfamily B multidrug efflux pump
VVMDRGEVREIGTHRELLDSSTIYRKLYDLQFDVQAEELATIS